MGALSLLRSEKAAFREVGLNSLMLAMQYGAAALVPLILLPHIVRTVGVSTFGNIAVALAWATFAANVVQYAFPLTGPKRIAQIGAQETAAGIFAEIVLAKLVLFACVAPVVIVVVYLTAPATERDLDLLIVLALPAAAVANATWYLQALNRFIWISIAAALGSAAALWYGFHEVVGSDRASVWAAALACVMGTLVASAGTLISAGAIVNFRRQLASIRPMFALIEGWPLFASQFVATLYASSGPIFISHLANTRDAGAYAAIERFIAAITGLCLLMHTAAYPRLAATYTRDRSGYRKVILVVVLTYLVATLLLATVGWILHATVERFILGSSESYSALFESGLAYLTIGIFGTVVTGYLTVSGRAREVFPLTLKVLAISFICGIPAVALWGGAGWMVSRVLGQLPVLIAAIEYWREERGFR